MAVDERPAPTAPGDGRLRLVRAVAAAEFELIPLPGAIDRAAALPSGATVTVTASPARGLDPTLELVEALAGRGFTAVPHLAARSIRDRAHLEDVLDRLDGAGIRRVFVVGGDGAEPGAFPDGLSLLRAVEDLGHRFGHVGIPGYPQGHADIRQDVLLRAMLDKQPFADHVTTQLSFDPRAIERWIAAARGSGVTLPVHVGLPGPADLVRLLRVTARIGVAGAASYLRKNRGLLGAILHRRAFRPDPLLDGLAATVADPASAVRTFHIYTFNQVEEAVRWHARMLERIRSG